MSIRIEYSKAHITARVVRREGEKSGERYGGYIEIVSRPRTVLLTSDIAYYKETVEETQSWYVKKIVLVPEESFRFILLCKIHGIEFKNIVRRGEVLEVEIRLLRFRKVYNPYKLVSRSVFKVLNIRSAKVVLLDPDIYICLAYIDDRIHSINISKSCRSLYIVINNFHIELNGIFRIIPSKYREQRLLYIIGRTRLRVLRHYPSLDKLVELYNVDTTEALRDACIVITLR